METDVQKLCKYLEYYDKKVDICLECLEEIIKICMIQKNYAITMVIENALSQYVKIHNKMELEILYDGTRRT